MSSAAEPGEEASAHLADTPCGGWCLGDCPGCCACGTPKCSGCLTGDAMDSE